VNGGWVAGVLVVTAIVAEVSKKSPPNLLVGSVLLKDKKDLVMPLHSTRSDSTTAPTNPKAWLMSRLFATVKESNTEQMFFKRRTAVPSSRSISTASFGTWMVQKSNVGEIPGSYEWGPNPTGSGGTLSIHMKTKFP
jgi:hypothetical protein